jgi:ATP-binding cassette subfamily B protein/subfamily B ATP-binding cassette protein MsbA
MAMNKSSYKYFFEKFVKSHAVTLAVLLSLNFLGMLFSLISPLLTKSLVDDVFIGGRTELFKYILLGTIGIYTISSFSSYVSSYLKGRLDLVIFRYVAEDIFNSIQYASLRKTQEMKIGDLLSRITGNARLSIYIFTYIFPEFLLNLLRICTPCIIMFYLSYQLALIIMVPIFLFLASSLIFGGKLEHKQRISLEKTASLYSFLKEILSIIPLIKVFGLESWSLGKFNEQINDYYDTTMDYTKTSSLSSSIGSLIYGVPMVLLIFFGGTMTIQGYLSLGTFTAFMSYVSLFFTPISQLFNLWTSYKSSSPAFDRINDVLCLEPDNSGNERLIVKDGVIKFVDVWFSYDNRSILQGFNATFRKGLNYIVGDNGTGKSTILKLLCALYSLERGYITIDEQNIVNVKKTDLRRNISIIFSDPYLFDASIYENILIGNLSAHEENVVHAAKLVRIHEFISSLPDGYKTQVGEDGLRLSSGEKQKISLARAVLKNSPIVLLDEVTKSIDSESRKLINEVIRTLKKEKTIIIITHNLDEIDINSNIISLEQKNCRTESINCSNDLPISRLVL